MKWVYTVIGVLVFLMIMRMCERITDKNNIHIIQSGAES
jgi:hypothetical protein